MTLGRRRNLATAVLIASGVGWAILAAVDTTIALTTDLPFPNHPLHSLTLAILITGTLSCLAVRTIQIGLVLLRRLDRVDQALHRMDETFDRIDRRLTALETAAHMASTTYHVRGVVPQARVSLGSAPTVDLAYARTSLKQDTITMPDPIDQSWLSYQAGLADRAFPLDERDADDDSDDDHEDGTPSVA